jgi:hypothetical protein
LSDAAATGALAFPCQEEETVITTSEDRERLSKAVKGAMRIAVGQKSAVPVREVARAIINETKSDPALFDDVLDALCALCIRNGLSIEFSRPPARAAG